MRGVIAVLLLVSCVAPALASKEGGGVITLTVTDNVKGPIDPRLFGQFLERPSWGETGPEAAVDSTTGALRPDVLALIEPMRIPIIRFPSGTDVDFLDWTDLVDRAPGRSGPRPVSTGHRGDKVSNRFGVDEYFRLRDRLGCRTILVANFLDALAKRKPLRDCALHAAGLVAYANAPLGAKLPEGMPDWPAIRAANGHPEPYRAEFIQIGNEWCMDTFQKPIEEAIGPVSREELAAWYLECLSAHIAAIRAVDPSIEIIIDAAIGKDLENLLLPEALIRKEVKWVAIHAYAPGPMGRVKLRGEPYEKPLTPEQFWYAATSMPGGVGADGQSVWPNELIALARSLGYQVACTEWNWNGWGQPNLSEPASVSWRTASAVGSAGFLHAMMRESDVVRLATQSMLVGHVWAITAVHYDPEGAVASHYLPQGAVTTFYNFHHGSERLETRLDGVETVAQPFGIGWAAGAPKVALLDVIATRDGSRLYVHVINRDFSRDHKLAVRMDGLTAAPGDSTLHLLEGRDGEVVPENDPSRYVRTRSIGVPHSAAGIEVSIPARAVAILEVPIAEPTE